MSLKQEREAKRRLKQGELALGVLQGITPQSCPDAAERAATVSRILHEKLAVKASGELSVQVSFYVQGCAHFVGIPPGPGRLVCKVHPSYPQNTKSFVERKHGFDIDDLVAALIPLDIKAKQGERREAAYRAREKAGSRLRDKLSDEGLICANVAPQTMSTGFKVSFVVEDLETAEEAIRWLSNKFKKVESRKLRNPK